MEKYYTPEISEFHVGFEFESKTRAYDGTVKTKEQFDNEDWEYDICSVGDLPYIERALTGRNAENALCPLRVKYLDSEDIIDLEFFHATSSGVCTVYGKRHPKANIYPELAYILRDNHATKKIEINQVLIGGNQITLFEGIIKNKSELRKLLKQLGI